MKNTLLVRFLVSALAVLAVAALIEPRLEQSHFVDETGVIESAHNFFAHFNYTPHGWKDFAPEVSTGLWCSFPSGIASVMGMNIQSIRLIFSLYCLVLLFFVAFLALRRSGKLIGPDLFFYSAVIVGLFVTFIPYPDCIILSLGEFPSLAFMGIGSAIFAPHSLLASFFWGLSAFGGKIVNLAFVVPALFLYCLASHRGRFKLVLSFLSPHFLWIGIILLAVGPAGLARWYRFSFEVFGTFYRIATQPPELTTKIPIPIWERFSDPTLEWVGYPFLLKFKILFFMIAPTIVTIILEKKRLRELGLVKWARNNFMISGMLLGQWVFFIWYFFVHPYMWIRHLVPALGVGFGILLFYFFNWYLSKRTSKNELAFLILAALLFSSRIIKFLI